MSKDGQDDKNVNNDKEKQKDTHDLQALNAIGSIISRMYSASNPTDLRNIVNDAKNIRSDDPRIQDIIEKVQEVVSRKELVAGNQLNSEQMQKALEELAELEKQRQVLQLQIHKAELERKEQNFRDLSGSLHTLIDNSIKDTTAKHEVIKNIHNDFKEGKPIDEEKLKQTEISSKEEIEELKQIYEERNNLEEEYITIKKEQISLKKEIEAKTKKLNSALTQEEKTKLQEELNLDNKKLQSYVPVLKDFQDILQSVDQKIEVRTQLLDKEEVIHKEIAKTLTEKKNINAQKHQKYEQHHKLLQEQHAAKKEIIGNYKELLQLKQQALSNEGGKEEKQQNFKLPPQLVSFIQKNNKHQNTTFYNVPKKKENKDKGPKR